jgi:hypothetical protein
MTFSPEKFPRRIEHGVLGLAIVTALAAGAMSYLHPADFYFAYRFAGLICFGPAAGSLIFLLIYRTTGGQWAESLQPALVGGARLLPWVWLLALPAVWLAPMPANANAQGHELLRMYESTTGIALRALAYAVVFFIFRWLCGPARTEQPAAAGGEPSIGATVPPHTLALRGDVFRGFGPAGLIVIAFTIHFLAVDWMFALEPEWHSTSFPLVWMAGTAVAGLALAVLAALFLGANPAAIGSSRRPLGLDWGNLLLTAMVFWAYVGFMEFLIIWNGDLPREVVWYVHRSTPVWRTVIIAVAILHVALPFFALLSRRVKQSAEPLAIVAALLLCAQLLYDAWMILPSATNAHLSAWLLDGLLALSGVSLFLNRYFAALRTAAGSLR